MKQLMLFALAVCFASAISAQYTVRLVITDVATKKLDDIYVAGSFNSWNPSDPASKLKPFGPTRRAIVLKNIAPGKYEFKFTRGTWDKVETSAKGEDIANRVIDVTGDVSLDLTVPGWKDDYPDKPKPNTATAQVSIIDTAFAIPQLNRTRRIWIYLPKSYATLKGKSYPVLYMQDGQNLFNEQTAPFGEWGVDECLDSLQKTTGKECIVVGIDNGEGKRMTEYNPYDNTQYGKGEGKAYAEFLATTLKPFIDKKYRTLKDAAHTYVAGSSMGALISLYTLMKYPTAFGAAGVLSPSFWLVPEMYLDVDKTTWPNMPRFYFYAGGEESTTMVKDMDRMLELIKKKNASYDVARFYYPTGKHNEATWRKMFPQFYVWLMR
ncbi:MAG: alpha/beta hydrolase [Filimonas sp.]|nr:alpha/beta hydrolase [Filimonas sp.]